MKDYLMEIDAGATHQLSITWTDSEGAAVDLTNYTAAMKFKKAYTDAAALISLTSDTNGGIVLTPATGNIMVTIPSDSTALLVEDTDIEETKGVYDLEVTDTVTGYITRLIGGPWIATPQVTK